MRLVETVFSVRHKLGPKKQMAIQTCRLSRSKYKKQDVTSVTVNVISNR